MVTVDPITTPKRFDPATDLTLIDPALKWQQMAPRLQRQIITK
jgi:hypothetical protein